MLIKYSWRSDKYIRDLCNVHLLDPNLYISVFTLSSTIQTILFIKLYRRIKSVISWIWLIRIFL